MSTERDLAITAGAMQALTVELERIRAAGEALAGQWEEAAERFRDAGDDPAVLAVEVLSGHADQLRGLLTPPQTPGAG